MLDQHLIKLKEFATEGGIQIDKMLTESKEVISMSPIASGDFEFNSIDINFKIKRQVGGWAGIYWDYGPVIDVSEMDAFIFEATAGNLVVLRMGEFNALRRRVFVESLTLIPDEAITHQGPSFRNPSINKYVHTPPTEINDQIILFIYAALSCVILLLTMMIWGTLRMRIETYKDNLKQKSVSL